MKTITIQIPLVVEILFVQKNQKNYLLLYNKLTKKTKLVYIDRNIKFLLQNKELVFSKINYSLRALLLTTITNIKNAIDDLIFYYKDTIYVKGAGFKVQLSKNKRFLLFILGYSHISYFRLPYNVLVDAVDTKLNTITLISLCRNWLYKTIAQIKRLKRIDSYKGKGIFLKTDNIILKKPKTAEKK